MEEISRESPVTIKNGDLSEVWLRTRNGDKEKAVSEKVNEYFDNNRENRPSIYALKQMTKYFCLKMKTFFKNCHRNIKYFKKTHENWLNKAIIFPVSENAEKKVNQDKQKECEERDKNIAQHINEASKISVLREADTNLNSLCQNPNGTSSIDEEECFQDAETNPAKQIDSASNDVTNNERRSIEPSEFEGYQIKQSRIDVSSDLGLLSSKSYIRNEPAVKNQTLKIIPQTSNGTEPDSLNTSMIDSLELNKEGLIHKLTDSIEVLQYDGKESLFSDHEAEEYESLGYITTDSIENISNFGKIGNTRFTSDIGIKTTVDFDKNYEKGKTDRRIFSNENVADQNKPVSLSDILFDSPSSSVQPTIFAEPTILNKKADCQSSSKVRINSTTDNVIPLTENSSTQSKTALEELIRNVNQTFAIGHNSVTKSKQEKEKLVSKEKIISSIEQNVESVNIPLNEKHEADNQKRKLEEIEASVKKLKSEEILKDANKKEVNVNANQELKSDTNLVKESSESNSEFINEEILIDKEVIDLKIKATENQIYDNHIVKNDAIDRTDFFKKSEKDNMSDKQFNESEKKPKETCESKGLQKVMPPTPNKQTQHEIAINKIENSVETKSLKSLKKLIDSEPNSDIKIKDREKHLEINHKLKCEKLLANNMIGKESSSFSEIKLDEKENFTPTAKEINQNQSVVIELRESTKQSLDCRNNQPEPPVEYQENNAAKGQNTPDNDSKQNTEETYENVSSNSLTNVDKENESEVKSRENKESGLRVEQNHNNVVYRQKSQYNDSKPMLEETQGDASKRVSIKENVKNESQVLQEKTLENNYSEQRKDQQINNVVNNVKTHENLSTEIPNCLQTKIDEKNKQATPREEQELQQNDVVGGQNKLLSKETHEHLNKEIISGLQTKVNKTEVLENKSTENNQTERPVKQQNDVGEEQNKLTEKNHEYLSKEIPSDLQTKVEKPEVLEVKSTENSEQKCEKTFRGEITETFENLEKQFKGEKTDKPKCQQNQEELIRNHKINKEISFNSEEIDEVQKVLTTVGTSSIRIKECLINKTDINQNTCSKEEQEQITEKCENSQEQVENKCTSKRAENHEPSRNNNIITEKQSSKTYIDEKDPAEVAKILNLKTSVIENELNDLVSNVTENKINNTVQQLENTSEEYLQLDSKLRTEDVLKGLLTNNTVVDTNNESSIKTKETDQTKVSETVNLKSVVKEGQVMENINQGRKAEAAVNKFDTKDCIDLLKESDASMFPETKEPFQNNLAEVVTLEADKKEFIIYQTKILDTNLLEKHQQESAIDERQDTKEFENQCKDKQRKENLESEIKGGSATFEPLVINNGKTMVEKAREQECNISYVRQDTKEFENLKRQYAEFDQNNQLKTEDIKCSKKGLEADNTRIYYRQDTREFEMLEKEFAESTSAINSPIIKGVGEETVFYRQDTEEFENLERQFTANAQNNTLIDDILGELVSRSTSTSGVEPIFSITSSNRAEEKINMEQAKENVKSVPGNDITIQIDNKNSQCVKISNKLNDQNKNNGKEIEFCRQDTEEFENLEKQCKKTIQKNTLGNDILGKLVSQNASTTDVEGNLYTINVNQAEGKINLEKTKDTVTVASGNSTITQINTKNNQCVEIPNKLDDQDQSTNHIIKHPLESNSDKTGKEIPFDDQQLSISEIAKLNLQGEKGQDWIDKSLINDDKQEDYNNKPLSAPGGSINKKKPMNRVEIHPTKVELLQQELDSIKKRNRRKEQSVLTSTTEKEVDKGVIFKYRKLIEDYEKHIAKQTEDLKKLKNESEINVRHFTNTEMAFSDVFEKYEKAKFVITVYRKNEDTLLENIQNAEEQLSKIEAKCQSMKQQSLEQIRRGNEQIVKEKAHYKQDITKLQAQVKRLEIKAASLELALKQKTDECQALAALCDDITGRNST